MPLFAKIPIDKKQLEAAIARLEQQTSAEFRIFIERKIPSKPTALFKLNKPNTRLIMNDHLIIQFILIVRLNRKMPNQLLTYLLH